MTAQGLNTKPLCRGTWPSTSRASPVAGSFPREPAAQPRATASFPLFSLLLSRDTPGPAQITSGPHPTATLGCRGLLSGGGERVAHQPDSLTPSCRLLCSTSVCWTSPLLSKLLAVQPLAQCIHSPVFSVTPTSGSLLPLTVGPPHTLSRDRVLFPSFPHLTLWGTPLALWVSLCPVPGEYPFLPHPAHVWHLPDTLALMIKGLTKKLGTRARKMGEKHPINYKVIKWPLDSSKN